MACPSDSYLFLGKLPSPFISQRFIIFVWFPQRTGRVHEYKLHISRRPSEKDWGKVARESFLLIFALAVTLFVTLFIHHWCCLVLFIFVVFLP